MKKILVVDDEQDIRELIQKKLVQNSYVVKTAPDGGKALKLCETTKFDLIIMDIAMPGMDGYQTCEQLKLNRDTKNIPVLLLTSKDLEPQGIVQRYQELEVAGYLAKPSSFEELLEKVKQILASDKGQVTLAD